MIDITTATRAELFAFALAVEPQLQAVDRMVRAFVALAPADRTMCAGCVWTDLLKPATLPWIGWERGLPHRDATEPEPLRFMTGSEFILDVSEPTTPTTEVEKWLRTEQAWDAVTDTWLALLNAADPGNGHGIGTLPTPNGQA
ncbi:hypothetical protein ACIGO9_26725 [Nocardia asteroides]|uniref:hypothetical protein n=1 Tax=Nocardia asteroides TaxID=1824 RepID=UPI0037CC72FD